MIKVSSLTSLELHLVPCSFLCDEWIFHRFADTITRCAPNLPCSPSLSISGAFCWLPVAIVLLTILSLVGAAVQWVANQATQCHCDPVTADWAMISLNAPHIEPSPTLIVGPITPIIFTPAQRTGPPGVASNSATNNTTKFNLNSTVPNSEFLAYNPTLAGLPINLTGTASLTLYLLSGAVPVTTVFCGVAYFDPVTGNPVVITELIAESPTPDPARFTITFPFGVRFTAAQLPAGGVVMFLYVRLPAPVAGGVTYSPINLSIQVTEVH